MIQPGLVSVTFRKLPVKEIIDLCVKARINGIEWGGDVHVPHGDTKKAETVKKMCDDAGLTICSYGSYYNFDKTDLPFEAVLETAVYLGAPVIRIWAGTKGSDEASEAYRKRIARESRQAAELAGKENIILGYEFHRKSLTDTAESARHLLQDEASHHDIGTYWQPPVPESFEERKAGLKLILDKLLWLHVFSWVPGTTERRPLASGADEWRSYFGIVREGGGSHWALLEFVKDDSPEMFLKDAAVLKNLLEEG
ncbi:MAG: sugar phosphate isomerase/epimerase family protein [Spirochaetia bacterium]